MDCAPDTQFRVGTVNPGGVDALTSVYGAYVLHNWLIAPLRTRVGAVGREESVLERPDSEERSQSDFRLFTFREHRK